MKYEYAISDIGCGMWDMINKITIKISRIQTLGWFFGVSAMRKGLADSGNREGLRSSMIGDGGEFEDLVVGYGMEYLGVKILEKRR